MKRLGYLLAFLALASAQGCYDTDCGRLSARKLPGEYALSPSHWEKNEPSLATMSVTDDLVTLTYERPDGSRYLAKYRVVAKKE